MFSNSNNSLPPSYPQSNTAARDASNRVLRDASPLTRLRIRRADIAVADADSPVIETIRDRGNNIVFQLTPRKDQDSDIKNPHSSDGSAFLTVALFFLILFLMWVLVMVILQHGEHEQNTRELILQNGMQDQLTRQVILQHGKQEQKTQELIDRLLQIFQEQRKLESRDHGE